MARHYIAGCKQYEDEAPTKAEEGRRKTLEVAMPHMFETIEKLNPNPQCPPLSGRAFLTCDLGEVLRQHKRWEDSLPTVTPHYGEHHLHSA